MELLIGILSLAIAHHRKGASSHDWERSSIRALSNWIRDRKNLADQLLQRQTSAYSSPCIWGLRDSGFVAGEKTGLGHGSINGQLWTWTAEEEAQLPDKTIIGTAHTMPLIMITVGPSSSPADHSKEQKDHHDSSPRTEETTSPNQTTSR